MRNHEADIADAMDDAAQAVLEGLYQAYLDNRDGDDEVVPFDEFDPADYEDTSEDDIPRRQ